MLHDVISKKAMKDATSLVVLKLYSTCDADDPCMRRVCQENGLCAFAPVPEGGTCSCPGGACECNCEHEWEGDSCYLKTCASFSLATIDELS